MNKIVCVLLALFLIGGCATPRGFEAAFDRERLEAAYTTFENIVASNRLIGGNGEGVLAAELAEIRSQNDYHTGFWYVVDAELQAIYGTDALAHGDVDLGEKWHRSAIETLMRGKQEHAARLEARSATTEFWANMIVGAVGAYYATEAGEPYVPQPWMEFPADLESIPVYEHRRGYLGYDVKRFPIFPGRGFLSGIGRVQPSGCTGFLVHPRVVLTNAHCVRHGEITFRLEYLTEVRKMAAYTYLTARGWNRSISEEENRRSNFRDDWALVVLLEGVHDAEILTLQPQFTYQMVESLAGKLVNVGYSSDLQSGLFLTMDYGCSPISYRAPIGSRSGIVRYDCRIWSGSSGSPVMIAGTKTVVALNAFSTNPLVNGERVACAARTECRGGGVDMSRVSTALERISSWLADGTL